MAEFVRKTLQTKPKGCTKWSTRSMAEEIPISRPNVQMIWNTFGLQPHLQRHFKISTDPFFVEKDHYIVGPYLNPPYKFTVLCVNEKSQIQTLDLTQLILPMGLGRWKELTMIIPSTVPPRCLPLSISPSARFSLNSEDGSTYRNTSAF